MDKSQTRPRNLPTPWSVFLNKEAPSFQEAIQWLVDSRFDKSTVEFSKLPACVLDALPKLEMENPVIKAEFTDQENKFQSLLSDHYLSLLEKVSVPPTTIRETDNYAPTGRRGTAA